jgi:hypothetical protein
VPSGLFNNPVDIELGACQWCGGTGLRAETIDDEREDMLVRCDVCQLFCTHCQAWVKRYLHKCPGEVKHG